MARSTAATEAAWRTPGTPLQAVLEDQVQAAFDELEVRPESLLILDNLADPFDLDRPVATTCYPSRLPGRMLFTTRQDRTGKFAAIDVDVLPEEMALQLLLDDASRRPILAPGHPERAEAQRIAALLGYLPLALEMAATFLGEIKPDRSLAAYRAALEHHGCIPLVDGGGISAGARRRIHDKAVAATLRQQWEAHVDADDRLLLRVAGQLPEASAIPIERLGLLSGVSLRGDDDGILPSDLEQALDRLAGSSLLERLGDDRGSVRLHPLVREFTRGQTPADAAPAFRRACAGRLSSAYDDFMTLEAEAAAQGVYAVQDDLLAALDLCQEPADALAPARARARPGDPP